jgi:hypothetical protein
MPHDDPRVFIVHSKSRDWQARLYDALEARLAKLKVRVTHYAEWSWSTPGGMSDHDRQLETSRYLQGYRDLEGMGSIKNPPPELELVLGRRPRSPDINRSDLARLIGESTLIVLVEEVGQEALSAGVGVELDILRESGKRTLNVRICDDVTTAYGESMYPLDEIAPSGGSLAVRRTPAGHFSEDDLDVVVLVLALWCDDEPDRRGAAPRWDQPKHDPDFTICPVEVSPRGMFRHEAILRLAASNDDHVRRTSLMYASTCLGHLRHELCRFLGRKFMTLTWASPHIDDYQRFMNLTPDIDWTKVVRALDANSAAAPPPPVAAKPWWRFWR